MERFPIIYVRGYAGPTAGIDAQVDDPFYGFNRGSTHIRVGGDGDPMYYQFEGPMLRLMSDENYRILVAGDQQQYLDDAPDGSLPGASIWVYRFYDQAATTFVPPAARGARGAVLERAAPPGHRRRLRDRGGRGRPVRADRAGPGEDRQRAGHPGRALDGRPRGPLHDAEGLRAVGQVPPRRLVAKFFTYGTPHGGIDFELGALDWAQQAFGPAGADIFAPAKMYGYLTPGRQFGDLPRRGDDWDPQLLEESVFPPDGIVCALDRIGYRRGFEGDRIRIATSR